MEDRIVTLDTFVDLMLAQVALAKLEAAGIPAFMDENAAGIYPLYASALGGYKVKVFEHDLDKCREVLSQAGEQE